jgi:hypothetical protein
MIIGVLGEKRHGKDTIGDYLVSKYGFTKESFAKPVKDIAKTIFGFNDEQLYGDLKETIDPIWNVTPRKVMQIIGTEIGQQDLINRITELSWVGRHIWVHSLFNRLRNDLNYVITDVRFQHEVDRIKEEGGIVIKVVRPSLITDNMDLHPSEAELRSIDNYTYLIENDSTINSLYEQIDVLYNFFNKWCEDKDGTMVMSGHHTKFKSIV